MQNETADKAMKKEDGYTAEEGTPIGDTEESPKDEKQRPAYVSTIRS